MLRRRWIGRHSVPLASFLIAVWALLGPWISVGVAETPDEAIRRIQSGRHTPMPAPATAPASGPAGKGMTIENGTGHALHVHFSGPVTRTVVVPDGKSESVQLAIGDYQVAAEVPGSTITPFYGRHNYQPLTHYWLKFYTQRTAQSAPRPAPAGRATEPSASATLKVTWEYASWSLPLLVAIDQGFFKQAGINVVPRELKGESFHISEADIITGHGLYVMTKEPDATKLRFIHTVSMRASGDMIKGFITKKDAGVSTWKDLKGKRKQIIVSGIDDVTLLTDFLRRQGLTVSDADSDIPSFLFGYSEKFAETPEAIALYGWSQDVRRYLEKQPQSYLLLAKNLETVAVADPYYVACTYINAHSYTTKPGAINGYLQVIDKAIDFIRQHPEKAKAVIPRHTEWKAQDVTRMGMHHFDKTGEALDFAALNKAQNRDLRPFHFSGSTSP